MLSNTFLPKQELGQWIAASASGWPGHPSLQSLKSLGSAQLSSKDLFAEEHLLFKESQ